MNIRPTKATFSARESFLPNPKAKLREQMHEVMRFKQFSFRTEGAYWNWIRPFLQFHRVNGQWRHPREMGRGEIESFLSYLAQSRNVAVSTQNQALNALVFLLREALVFLLREALGCQLGEFGDFTRARKVTRVPVVLTRSECQRLFAALAGVPRLMAS